MEPLPLNTIIHISHWPEGDTLCSIYRTNINNFTRQEEIQIHLFAAKGDKWLTTLPRGAIPLPIITSWKIVPVTDLPLYISYPFVWPILSNVIKDGQFYPLNYNLNINNDFNNK